MSVMRCEIHNRNYDTDYETECKYCIQEEEPDKPKNE